MHTGGRGGTVARLEEGGEPRRRQPDPFPPRHLRRQRRRAARRHHRRRPGRHVRPARGALEPAGPGPVRPRAAARRPRGGRSCPTTTGPTRWPSRSSARASTTRWSTRTWPPTRRPTSSSTAAPTRSSPRTRSAPLAAELVARTPDIELRLMIGDAAAARPHVLRRVRRRVPGRAAGRGGRGLRRCCTPRAPPATPRGSAAR